MVQGKRHKEVGEEIALELTELANEFAIKTFPGVRREDKKGFLPGVIDPDSFFISGRVKPLEGDEGGFVLTNGDIGRIIYLDPKKELLEITRDSHPDYFCRLSRRKRG